MMLIAGTVPIKDMPLTMGKIALDGDFLLVDGKRIPCTQGTGAMVSAALATTSYLGLDAPHALLVGDIGEGKGSRELYQYLIDHVAEFSPDVLALHYWLPDMSQTRQLCAAIEKCRKRPVMILFETDISHTPELARTAYENHGAARLLLVKGSTDYIIRDGEVLDMITEPDVPMLEPIGGTGDTITGVVSALAHAELEPHEAAIIAARANRMAGKYAKVTPATKVRQIIDQFPSVFKDYLCEWSGVCYVKGGY